MGIRTEKYWLDRFLDTPVGGAIGIAAILLTSLVAGAAFLGSWAYAIATYGWFLGGTLGWIPAAIIAFVVWVVFGALSPFVVVLLVVAIVAFVVQLIFLGFVLVHW